MAERLGNIIELKHITKTYTDNGFTAVSDFNLEVGRGEFVTFGAFRMWKNDNFAHDCRF